MRTPAQTHGTGGRPGAMPPEVPMTLEYPAVTVGELMIAAARRFGERTALEDAGGAFSFTEMSEHAAALAHRLREDGIGVGDHVMVHLPNSRWTLVAYLGTVLAGAAAVPCNPLHTWEELNRQLRDLGVRTIITHPDFAGRAVQALPETRVRRLAVVPGEDAGTVQGVPPAEDGTACEVVDLVGWISGASSFPPSERCGPDDVAHLAFTGGTTGIPKGVRVLHRNVVANICQALALRAGVEAGVQRGEWVLSPPARDDAGLGVADGTSVIAGPLFHAQALFTTLFLLSIGTTVYIMERFDAERMLDLIDSRRVTYLNGSPTLWYALVEAAGTQPRDLSSVRVVSSGAAPISAAALAELRRLFPEAMVNEAWGLSEATAVVTSVPGFHDVERRLGSVGVPLPDTQVQARDADGCPVPQGAPGELWIRGPQVTGGYFGEPELTAEQFVDGWLRTGDVGSCDTDGRWYVTGRSKDTLLYKGYNVYPRELEELLLDHPAIAQAAVVGRPESRTGQLPVAFVVARDGTGVDPDELMRYVAERVLPYKKIREVHQVSDLPRTSTGKIRKTELTAWLSDT